MNILAICFDADGVVVNPQKQFSRHLAQEHGISPAMTRSFFEGVFNDCLVGKANLKAVLPPFLKDWGWEGSVDEFIQIWLLTDHVVDGRLLKAIHSLRSNGLICCLTTSQERNRAEYMKAKMGFQEIFDQLFFSCEIGWQKPHHTYYQRVEQALNVDKGSILLWDDARSNVEAARECGWNAELYTNFDEFEQSIKHYGINLAVAQPGAQP